MKKTIQRIIIFILVILLALPISTSLAYADGYNGTGGGAGGASGSASGGASENKCGYRMYVVDKNGNIVSEVIDLVVNNTISCDINMYTTRIGNSTVNRLTLMPAGMPKPYYYSGSSFKGNGTALRAWAVANNESGHQNIITLIENELGLNVANYFDKSITTDTYYCILEPITWHDIFSNKPNSVNMGRSGYGTFYNWMQLYDTLGLTKTFTSSIDNDVLGNCMILQRNELGLKAPASSSDNFSLSSINGIGYGIHIYSNDDLGNNTDDQTTYDESKGDTPAPPADESDGAYTIVKNYRYSNDGGNTYIDAGCYNITNIANKIIVENEQSYKVVGWKISNKESTNINSLTWESSVPGTITQTGTTAKTVQLSNTEKCLYVLLEKTVGNTEGTGDFEISQASLTKRVRFSESSTTNVFNNHSFKWTSEAFSLTSCNGHSYTDNCGNMTNHNDTTNLDGTTNHSGDTTYCGGHTDYCSNFKFLDDSVTVSIKNESVSEASKIMVQKHGWENVVQNTSASSLAKYWHTFNRTLTSASTLGRNSWDYVCVLWRGEDDLTVAQWKNDESTNKLMSSIGFSVANVPQGTRKTSDFINTFVARFGEDTGSNREVSTKYGASTASPHSNKLCTQTRDYTFKADSALSLSNIKVNVKVYSGQANRDNSNGELKKNQAEVGSITFYPYIKMKYDTYNMPYANNYSQTAYVLGNYARTLNLRNGVTVRFESEDDNSLEIQSNQWSVHNSLMKNINDLFGTTDNAYKVIPGGATLNIKNRDDAKSKDVKVITYQCLLEGDGKTQVDQTGSVNGDFTEATANSNHAATVSEVVDALKNLKLELYGNKDAKKEPFSGDNITKSKKFNGKSISSDSKYNWDDFNDLYINVEEGNTSTEKYIFSADAEGNIRMNGTTILTKGQGVESISDRTAKTINNKTDVVNQLVKALERNAGNDDSTAWSMTDKRWYNEAFDGVTVYVQTTVIHTGLWDPMERTTVFDTKLTPNQSSKENIGTSFYSFQMRTAAYSDLYEGEVNRLGSFMGVNVFSNVDLTELYKTDKWYSSNITTQDLK